MIKSVAKITPEFASEIAGTQAEGAPTLFNPVSDGNGNIIISLPTAQYLTADKYEIINWVPPVVNEEEI